MPTLLVRRAAVLFKIEAVEGVGETPDPATDGVLVENVRITFNPNIVETNEVTPSLDPFSPIVGGMTTQIEFDVYMNGSGAAATPPEWGDLMKVCGFSETITATAIPAAPEVFGTAGTTTTGGLGTTAVGTAGLYRGMPIVIVQGGNTTETFISQYLASKTATFVDTLPTAVTITHTYQIPAHVLYSPASSSISSGTCWIYNDGILYKFTGNRGNVVFNGISGGPWRASFRLMGQFLSKTDAALPTVTYATARPQIWKNGRCKIQRLAASMQTLSLDMGNQLAQPDNPNELEGYDPGVITARNPRGTMNPKETLVATRDIMTDFRSQTFRIMSASFGSAAGNRIGITIPRTLYLNQTPGDRNGYRVVDVPFHMDGQDTGVFIASW